MGGTVRRAPGGWAVVVGCPVMSLLRYCPFAAVLAASVFACCQNGHALRGPGASCPRPPEASSLPRHGTFLPLAFFPRAAGVGNSRQKNGSCCHEHFRWDERPGGRDERRLHALAGEFGAAGADGVAVCVRDTGNDSARGHHLRAVGLERTRLLEPHLQPLHGPGIHLHDHQVFRGELPFPPALHHLHRGHFGHPGHDDRPRPPGALRHGHFASGAGLLPAQPAQGSDRAFFLRRKRSRSKRSRRFAGRRCRPKTGRRPGPLRSAGWRGRAPRRGRAAHPGAARAGRSCGP